MDNKIEIRTFEESNSEKLVVYNVKGANYSEGCIKAMLEYALRDTPPDVPIGVRCAE
jgi:hypothetical protein